MKDGIKIDKAENGLLITACFEGGDVNENSRHWVVSDSDTVRDLADIITTAENFLTDRKFIEGNKVRGSSLGGTAVSDVPF